MRTLREQVAALIRETMGEFVASRMPFAQALARTAEEMFLDMEPESWRTRAVRLALKLVNNGDKLDVPAEPEDDIWPHYVGDGYLGIKLEPAHARRLDDFVISRLAPRPALVREWRGAVQAYKQGFYSIEAVIERGEAMAAILEG